MIIFVVQEVKENVGGARRWGGGGKSKSADCQGEIALFTFLLNVDLVFQFL